MTRICDDSAPPTESGNPAGAPNSCQKGSIIIVEKRAVGENIAITGTPYFLNYMSHKNSRLIDRTTQVQLVGSSNTGVSKVGYFLSVAGKSYTASFDNPPTNLTQTVTWDGNDQNRLPVFGLQTVSLQVLQEYQYNRVGVPTTYLLHFRNIDVKPMGAIGGWTLNIHHAYDVNDRVIYYGDGTDSSAYNTPLTTTGSEILVPANERGEAYVFDDKGHHLRTLFSKKGTIKYLFNYNAQWQLLSVIDHNGLQLTINRDTSGHPISLTGHYGQRTILALDANGYLRLVKNPANEQYTITYSPSGLMLSFKNPKGVLSQFIYDSTGQLIRDSSSAGSSLDLSFLSIPNGTSTTTTSAMGLQKNYSTANFYDSVSNNFTTTRTTSSLVASSVNYINYKDTGRKYSEYESDDLGVNTTRYYDVDPQFGGSYVKQINQSPYYAFEEMRSVVKNGPAFFDIASYTQSYNQASHPNGPQSSQTVYDGTTSTYTYTSPLGKTSTLTIDNFERPTLLKSATDQPLSFLYDAKGRISKLTHGARSTIYSYNAKGLVRTIRNALAQSTTFTYDSAGRVISQTLPDTRLISFTYDKMGNLTSVTPPGRSPQTLSYNNFDLLSGYLSSTPTSWAYDNDRKLTSLQRPNGETAQYIYDPTTARLAQIQTPSGTFKYNFNSSYNYMDSTESPDGVVETFNNINGILTFIDVQGPVSGQWLRALNADYSTLSTQVSGGSSISYTYDNDSLLTQVGALVLTRNAGTGRIIRTQLQKIFENKNYTTYGELSVLRNRFQNLRIYQDYKFTRDKLGRLTTKLETLEGQPQSTFTYTYDTAGRLQSVLQNGSTIFSQTFDSNSNRIQVIENGITTTAAYDINDQILTWGSLQFTHNLNGDLTTITNTTSVPNGVTTYNYNVFGHLKTVTLPNGGLIEYLLDAHHRRVGKKINGSLIKQWLWQDSLRPLAEYDANGTLVSEFIYAQSANAPDYMIRGGVKYKLLKNHLGSVLSVVNSSTGAVAQSLTYSIYGKVLSDSNPGFQPFGFAGGLYDPDTGLVRFGAREYNAMIGRWMTKDPILFNGGDTNLYGYVLNDPINFIDPDGKVPLLIAAPLIGGAWGGVVGIIGAASTGGSWADIRSAAATGAIGGAVAGLGLATGLGAAAATAAGLGASMLTALPDSGANPADVGAGLQQLLNPPARSCPQ